MQCTAIVLETAEGLWSKLLWLKIIKAMLPLKLQRTIAAFFQKYIYIFF